jgi:hypothetical protein
MNNHEKDKEDIEQEKIEETNEDSCGCCCESEDISLKEVAYHADDKVDALIQLLIKKNIFTEHEFEEEYNALFEEEDKEE